MEGKRQHNYGKEKKRLPGWLLAWLPGWLLACLGPPGWVTGAGLLADWLQLAGCLGGWFSDALASRSGGRLVD